MAKIPFSIEHREKIESGEYKVETRDGRAARIICWDRRGERPLVVLVQNLNGYDEGLFYYDNGLADGVGQEHDNDLFLVTPEPELTPLEDLLSTYLKNDFEYFSTKKWDEKKWNEVIRIQAAELLSLARKQLQPEIDAEIEKAYKNVDEVQYRKGREEALKDLPRWRKMGRMSYYSVAQFVINGRYLEMNDTLNDVYEIALSDLEKLPKEDEK